MVFGNLDANLVHRTNGFGGFRKFPLPEGQSALVEGNCHPSTAKSPTIPPASATSKYPHPCGSIHCRGGIFSLGGA
jgi:hypothetical protein